MKIETIIQQQRVFFNSQKSKSIQTRKWYLKKLRNHIIKMEDEIHDALAADLGKSKSEAYMSETGMVLSELTYQLRHIDSWAKPKKVKTPFAQWKAESFSLYEPYGVVLIMSPWNYPFQLTLEPMIGAIAAGNTVIIKPSAYAPATSNVIANIIADVFPREYVTVIEGGRKENIELLNQRFDYIFFTGSVSVGKLVMEKASRYLTPVTLELGGKSPCIIDKSADLKIAAKRIAFGKFLNAGQTCVAPDYIYIEESIKYDFLAYLQQAIQRFYPKGALQSSSYPNIINEKHFYRLWNLMKEGNICFGGNVNLKTRQIEPTVIENIDWNHAIMQEEIFGPLLPVMTYRKLDDVISVLQKKEKPLALYLFTSCKENEKKVLSQLSFGGGCINDTIIHLATSNMSFGGVGNSGMGSYHGYASFQTFSHTKNIVKKATWADLPFRYPPYTSWKDFFIRMFLK